MKAEPQKLPSRTISVEFNGNSYEISYPNTGKLIDIELLKMKLSDNEYKSLSSNFSSTSSWAKYSIDMIATLTYLVPDLKKDMRINFTEMEALDAKELLKVYLKKILSWLMDWQIVLNSDDEAEEENEEGN